VATGGSRAYCKEIGDTRGNVVTVGHTARKWGTLEGCEVSSRAYCKDTGGTQRGGATGSSRAYGEGEYTGGVSVEAVGHDISIMEAGSRFEGNKYHLGECVMGKVWVTDGGVT